jgi:hypothetical protein
MRRLAADETAFFISEADVVDKSAGQLRPTGNPVLDADTEVLFAQRRAEASTEPAAPIHQLVNLLPDLDQLTETAYAAAQGQGS